MIHFLNKFYISKRLWLNLIISTIFLISLALSSRYALQDVQESATSLTHIQQSKTVKIAEFKTQFSNSTLSMNDYILTLNTKTGVVFNQKIDALKTLNQGLVEVAFDNEDALFTQEMETLLVNIKKSANSSVFLKKQIQETLIYGIDPSAQSIENLLDKLSAFSPPNSQTNLALSDIADRFKNSQQALLKMISVNDPSYRQEFDKNGLGDSASKIFEQLESPFEKTIESEELYTELVEAWEAYQESFYDLKDGIQTTTKNNQTLTELASQANHLLQKIAKHTDQETAGLIQQLTQLSQNKTQEMLQVSLFAILVMLVFNLLLIKSIARPLENIKQQLFSIAQNGTYQQWSIPQGNNELTDMAGSIHNLLSSIVKATSEITQVNQSLAQGDLCSRMKGSYQGELAELKHSYNQSLSAIEDTFQSIDNVSLQLANGEVDTQINCHQFQGDYLKVMSNLSRATNVQQQSITAIKSVMQAMSEGAFDQRITVDLPGEYNHLKSYLNHSLESLEQAIQINSQILDNYQQGNFAFEERAQFKGKLHDLKSHMDTMAKSMSSMLNEVQYATLNTVQGIKEINKGNQDLSLRVQDQATSLQNTTQNMQLMANDVSQSLLQATEMNHVSEKVKQTICDGQHVVEEMSEAMTSLSTASQEIANMTSVIDSIAFQTNLLALNAAVEAARAGEAGRGFAVVAAEVRLLAQKSAEAAKEIRNVSQSSLDKVNIGLNLSQLTTQTFEENRQAIEQVTNLVSGMYQSLQKQTEDIQSVSFSLNDIDNSTQQNASLVEEISATSTSIIKQVEQLELSTSSFRTLKSLST